MDVRMESAAEMAARNQKQKKTKRQRPMSEAAPSPKKAARGKKVSGTFFED